jgi:hypothetical protein
MKESEEETPIKIFTDQREAFTAMKDDDPDKTKKLAIYPVEV